MTYSDLEEELDDMAADLAAARVKLDAVRELTQVATSMLGRVVAVDRLLAILDGPASPQTVTEPEPETAGEMLRRLGTDAVLWAQEFAANVDLTGGALDPSPGESLHAWFCSAIENGRSAGAAQEARTGEHRLSMAAALGPHWRDAGPAEPHVVKHLLG